ncbi:MAG: NAD(P)-dependent alcohol dehydrogenase [Pseudomonas sp.]|uniref:zinc-dependent alcohol dehydrogenase family protein n=1 Tax=Pseudomonas sp. TaxID=306 RepID=UPI00339229B6
MTSNLFHPHGTASDKTLQRCVRLSRQGRGLVPVAGLSPLPEPGPHEVLICIEATSLNYRDLLIAWGRYGGVEEGRIPLSDCAGVVLALGSQVSEWQKGDRVMPGFFKDWLSGPFKPAYGPSASGGESEGVLARTVVMPASALVRVPDYLDGQSAATLPCAAVTAWQALFERARPLKAGDTLLVQGTGGVALFALQLGLAQGARVIVLSSSDAKLERARAMGAWGLINYRDVAEWDTEVLRLTEGEGVQHILELGGAQTFQRSLNCLAYGGQIAQIGLLSGSFARPDLGRLQRLNATLEGIAVGSVQHLQHLVRYLETHRIEPVIDRVFHLDEVEQAYAYLASGQHFGKVVIRV